MHQFRHGVCTSSDAAFAVAAHATQGFCASTPQADRFLLAPPVTTGAMATMSSPPRRTLPIFRLSEFTLRHSLGEGTFGKVMMATEVATGEAVAVKFLKVLPSGSDEDFDQHQYHTELADRPKL